MLNIVFMGTPDFAKESLQAIYNAGHSIQLVITNIDKPKGRGMKMVYSPVKEFAIEKDIPIIQPEKVRGNVELIDKIKSLAPDVICVVAYGKILPVELLEIPKKGSINVHGSLLPKYRGAAPIQWSVLNGDKETGITTMYMDAGMDTGDMILTKKVEIDEDDTTGTLWEKLAKIGAELLVETLDMIEKNEAPRKPQMGEPSIAPMLNKEMAKIDWENQKATDIHNLVRGLNPIMGAYGFLNDKKIKIWKTKVLSINAFIENHKDFEEYVCRLEDLEPGTIIYIDNKKGVYIKTKDDILLLLEVQAENSKKMSILDFLRGNKLEVGEIFI